MLGVIGLGIVSFWTTALFGWKIALACIAVLHFMNIINVFSDVMNLLICLLSIIIANSIPKSRK